MTKSEFLGFLHDGDFTQLFLECLWNNPTTTAPQRIPVGDAELEIREVAQRGVKVFVSNVEKIPDSAMRRLVDARLRRLCHEYFVIYVSATEPFHHLWSVPVKTVDRRQLVSVEYTSDDQAAFLVEKVNALSFGPDESPTVIDVAQRVNSAFLVNTTDVTKKFYQSFKKQHDMFVKGIANIEDATKRDWYASVMLNRLMFCYFIQKKRFLDFDENYLRNKLAQTQESKGRDKFYVSFYRSFLKQLFSDGLDKPHRERSAYFIRKYGRIPYLNGGMFSLHQIERENKDIDIPDEVFEKLFDFFDEWRWHLDNRITATGRDINPDVLGYIFEQYINDRAQMGAYYTKEDITEYIGRNTIVPWIVTKAGVSVAAELDSATAKCADGVSPADRYIFPAMRKGTDIPLPPEIENGVAVEPQETLRKRRAGWNKPASEEYALPTEIWRETVVRRQRCAEIRAKLANGEIRDIHDFITYNLDIRAFAEDVIRNTSDHLLVLHVYKAIREVTILDPTCGSGAFLFAALNILEPLYEACLDRMEEFHARNERLFKDELAESAGKFRSNRQYFIYKNIILRNLYGVDIMPEATEIARLRLFLKMVAVVDVDDSDENLGLDPLPDIDFNIRCGNTLVGYATEKEIKDGLVNGDMFAYVELKGKIESEMKAASMASDFFRREQLNLLGDHKQLVDAKRDITKLLDSIRNLLNDQIYDRYSGKSKDKWLADTQPFHWYTEFYHIMHDRGGFDVIIGNPPYVEYSKIKNYRIKDYKTESCGNLYAFVIERCNQIISENGRSGMIVPLSGFTTPRMGKLIDQITNSLWFSSYDFRPSKLFEGVNLRLAIALWNNYSTGIFSTKYNRWHTEARESLLTTLSYQESRRLGDSILKFSNMLDASIFKKTYRKNSDAQITPGSNFCLYYHDAILYWLRGTDFEPSFNGYLSSHAKKIPFASNDALTTAIAKFNSSLFYWFWNVQSNCRDLSIEPLFHLSSPYVSNDLKRLIKSLMKDYLAKSKISERNQKATGLVRYREFYPKLSKPIIDEIDELLAKHYGFTEEELDFIINYDIKYRMGDELNASE